MAILKDFFKKISRDNSFTLIELLIVSVIIMILSAIILSNFNLNQGSLTLQDSAQQVALNVDRAENLALASVTQYE